MVGLPNEIVIGVNPKASPFLMFIIPKLYSIRMFVLFWIKDKLNYKSTMTKLVCNTQQLIMSYLINHMEV